jgi:hypothetical protein
MGVVQDVGTWAKGLSCGTVMGVDAACLGVNLRVKGAS